MSHSSPPTFPAVYREHVARIRRAVHRAGVPTRHCDDVTQEALLRIHEALPRFDPDRKLSAWLLRIAYFTAIDHLRRSEHREQPTAEIDVVDPRTELRSPERDAETGQAVQAFCDAAAVLPDSQRVVFLMHELDELTLPDIAAALEIPLGTATSRLLRGRQAFEAAVSRRRVIEDRKLGGASALPVFLASSEALLDAGRTFPEVSPADSARMWGRVTRATMTGVGAGALSRLAALTPRQVVGAVVLAGGLGLVAGIAATFALVPRGSLGSSSTWVVPAAPVAMALVPNLPSAAVTSDLAPVVVGAPAVTAIREAPPQREPEGSSHAERALLDHAQSLLRQGDPAAAKRALDRHAKLFPAGLHAEERERLLAQVAAPHTDRSTPTAGSPVASAIARR